MPPATGVAVAVRLTVETGRVIFAPQHGRNEMMQRGHGILRSLLPLAVFAVVACDDGLGPRAWDPTPDTALLYSATRPELIGLPAAFDFVGVRRLNIETSGATGAWDAALAEQNGEFVFVPAGNFPGVTSRAAISERTETTLEALTRAPGDTAAYTQLPVRLRTGAVYAVRTRTASCVGFGVGTYYAKFQVVSMDGAAGSVRIAVVVNPYCNDRSLIPEED